MGEGKDDNKVGKIIKTREKGRRGVLGKEEREGGKKKRQRSRKVPGNEKRGERASEREK